MPLKLISRALLLALTAPHAFAATSAAERSAATLDAIEVSARKPAKLDRVSRAGSRLQLSAKDTPASITVLSQADLREKGEITPLEALENAPGVAPAYSFGVLNISGRGFSGVQNSPALFDGIRYPGFQITPRLLLNYEQVEVLRGPAGLAAGQGSVAGTINYVPRRALAENADQTQLYLAFGRFGTSTAAAGTGGTIGNSPFAFRIDAAYQGSDQRGSYGYARDSSFAFEHINAELAWQASERVELALSAEHFADDAEGYFGSPLINGRLDERLGENNYNVVNDRLDMRVNWLRARLNWQINDTLNLRVQGFGNDEQRDWRNTESYTANASTQSVARADFLEIAHQQELRGVFAELSFSAPLFGLAHRGVVGVQVDRNNHDRFNDSPFRFSDRVALIDPARGSYISLDPYGLRTATEIDQRALFVESVLELNPMLKLITGLRHDIAEVDSFNALSSVQFDKRYSTNSGRAGLVYVLSDELNLYGSYASSSEPPAQITTLGQANAAFDLTDADQVEIGIKQAFARGEWSAALYDLRRTNILSRDPADPNRLIQVGEQAARGLELEAQFALSDAWRLQISAAALKAEFKRFDERVGNQVISRRGNVPVDVPERLASIGVVWQLSPVLDLGLNTRAVGRRTANTANTVFLPGYATVDASLRWRSAFGNLGLRLRNLDDRLFATRSYGPNQFMLGEPRLFELSWQRSF